MVVLKSSEYAPFRIIRFTLFTKIISTRVTWGFNVFLENKIINRQWSIKMFCTRITNSKSPLNFKKTTYWSTTSAVSKGDVTRDDSQRRFLAQRSVAMLEQCCNHSKQCRSNAARLRCAKNRFCESSRVTSPVYMGPDKFLAQRTTTCTDHLSFTRDPQKSASCWTVSSTAICNKNLHGSV